MTAVNSDAGNVRRPFRRCPECSHAERAARVTVTHRRRWYQVRTRVTSEPVWSASCCPVHGVPLVDKCQHCEHPLVMPDDECCRECGRAYWWMLERRRGNAVNRTWRADLRPIETFCGVVGVYALQHSIAHIKADAVVSTDDQSGAMRGGSAAALKREGGDEIEQQSTIGRHALGDAWHTSGGRLEVQHVIHVAVMDVKDGTTEEIISQATTNSLGLAERYQVKEIVYPALGTGRSRLPMGQSVPIMRAAIERHVTDRVRNGSGTSLEAVLFALFSPEDKAEFLDAYAKARDADR